ncbi:MAG TPA: TIGR02117 family protein [Flavobacterium sp.]|nr:TIGR02117 family protein [Flavobacterium sp.]HPJ09462.1 TIGR02117 family protein [Flavobacterium sp.]
MKSVKKGFRWLLKLLIGIIGFIVVYGLVVFVLSRITVNSEDKQADGNIAIYIKSNGVHTDIVVPVTNKIKDWRNEVAFDHTLSKDSTYQYIGFGWGDKGFYLNTPQWSDLKVSTACNAMFYLGNSAMHATFFYGLKEGERCVKINISQAEYQKLVAYIQSGFCGQKATVIPNAHYGDNDSFYEGEGRYSLFYTCNSWANNALKAADQKAALWTLTDTGILCHYR